MYVNARSDPSTREATGRGRNLKKFFRYPEFDDDADAMINDEVSSAMSSAEEAASAKLDDAQC